MIDMGSSEEAKGMVEQVKDRDLEGQEIEVELPHSAVDRQAKPDTQEQQSSSLYYRIADGFNAVVHLPVVEYIFTIGWWSGQMLLGPYYFFLLLGLVVYDMFTGYVFWRYEQPAADRPIVITGCDTGFGHDLALRLYEKGWTIYASCLTDNGMQTLKEKTKAMSGSTGTLVTLKVDVTKAADVQALISRVENDHPQGLYALVNNAGINSQALIDWLPIDGFRHVMEVNYFSMVTICKGFLPMLKRSKNARVVNVVSMAGLVPGLPGTSAYCASKHAAEAFTSSLRMEMKAWGIKVSTLNPSFHRTAIVNNVNDAFIKLYRNLSPEVQAEYGETFLQDWLAFIKIFQDGGWHPKHVCDAMVHATTGTKPREQYIVGVDGKSIFLLLRALPVRLGDAILQARGTRKLVPAAVLARKQN